MLLFQLEHHLRAASSHPYFFYYTTNDRVERIWLVCIKYLPKRGGQNPNRYQNNEMPERP
jgi:hypothetical protein